MRPIRHSGAPRSGEPGSHEHRPLEYGFRARGLAPAPRNDTEGAAGQRPLMRVLVVGSGGREHALAWAIAASPLVDQVYCAPGNAGIAEEAECVALAASDTKGIIEFCRHAAIDFVVVGPEAPLVLGLVDAFEDRKSVV